MKVALISVTKASIDPIENAFRKEAPYIELIHFMDTSLFSMIQKEGGITSNIIRRFSLILNLAVDSKADCIQLTCSAFNDIVNILQPLYDIKLMRSDEAMLDEALVYKRVGLISTVQATPPVLTNYLKSKSPNIQIASRVDQSALRLLNKGKRAEHDNRVKKMIDEMDGKVDVIVLTQYSLEQIANQVSCSTPILTAPRASAKRCYSYLQSTIDTSQ